MAAEAPGAAAGPVTGALDLTFQRVEQHASVLFPNGVIRDTVLHRDQFFQSYQVSHAARIGRQIDVTSQLQLNDYSYTDRPHARRTLAGTLRLAHPVFGVTGSYRPTTNRTVPASLGLPDNVPVFRSLVTKQQDALVTAYVTPPSWPRLDLSWTRRRRDPEPDRLAETSIQRNVRLSYALGVIDVHGGYGDLSRSPRDATRTVLDQRNTTAGASLRLLGTERLSVGVNYDFGYTLHGASTVRPLRSYMQSASLGSTFKASSRSTVNLGYNFRRSENHNGEFVRIDDQDGSLLWNYAAGRSARLSAGAGVHTTRRGLGARLDRYVTVIGSNEGTIRSGWTASISGSHVTSWDPDGRRFSTEAMHLGSNYRMSRDFQMNASWDGTLNSDLPGSAGRLVTQAGYGFQATPLRHLQVNFSDRQYRSGASLLRPVTAARTWTLDGRVRLSSSLDVTAGMTRTGPRIGTDPQTTSRQATVGWRVASRLQLSGTYTKSDQRVQFAGTSQLSGSEVYGMRLAATLSRSLFLKAGTYQVDPHTSRFSRQWEWDPLESTCRHASLSIL